MDEIINNQVWNMNNFELNYKINIVAEAKQSINEYQFNQKVRRRHHSTEFQWSSKY